MDSSAYRVGLGEINRDVHTPNPPSKLKTYGFAIAIIIGIGGLAIGGVGLAGYLGALSNLNQVQAMIMMTAGGGGGMILFSIGVVGIVINCQNTGLQHDTDNHTHRSGEVTQPLQVSRQEIIRTPDTQGGLVYRADAWRIWGAEVLDRVPPAPSIDWNANDPYFNEPYHDNFVLLYIPQRIRVGGEEKDLTLQTLGEISGGPFNFFPPRVADQLGGSRSHGWMLVSKKVIPESRNKSYEAQKNMVEANVGFRMPQALEAVALNLMVFAVANKRLYGVGPLTYTKCVERVGGIYPVVVGGFSSAGLDVRIGSPESDDDGIAALRKF